MQSLLPKLVIATIAILPFVSPMGMDWSPLVSAVSLKTAWGIISVSILFVLWVFSFSNEKTIIVKKTNLYYPILGFTIWCFVSLFWVKSTYLAAVMLAQFVSYGLIFFLILNIYKNLKDAENLLKTIVISLTIVSVIGLLQYYFSENNIVQSIFVQAIGPSSTFGNKNLASHFVVMTLPISIIFFLSSKDKKNLGLYATSIVVSFWYLYLIQARQAYLAVVVELFGFLLFVAIDFIHNKDQSFVSTTALKKLKALPVLLIIASLFLLSLFNINKIQSLNYESSLNARLPAWNNSLEMIKENPIIGVGVGQWPVIYPMYYDRVKKDVIFNEKTRLGRLHNDYLEMFANLGLVGYVFLLWLVFLFVTRVWFILSNVKNKDRLTVLGATLGLVGFGVISMFSYPIQTYLPVFMVLTYLGLIELSFIGNHKNLSSNRYGFNKLMPTLISVLLAFLIVTYSLRWTNAEHNYHLAKKYEQTQKFDLATVSGINAIRLNPLNARNYIVTGNNYLRSKDPSNAIKKLEQAIKLMPFNTLTLLNLASAYRTLENTKMEHEALNTILSFDSKNVTASAKLVRILTEKKQYKEATIIYRKLKDNFEYFKERSGFGPYHDVVGWVAIFVGDYPYARYIYQDAIRKEPSAENLMKLGTLEFFNLKNLDIGSSLYMDAIKLDNSIQRFEEIESYIKNHEPITDKVY